jgi:hypothetical protein
MEIFLSFLVLCVVPLGLFFAGWGACYITAVRYRVRVERRTDLTDGKEWQA